MTAELRVEDRGHVRVLVLDREAVRNAIDLALHTALIEQLLTADARGSVRAIVLTGAGTRAFSAGADLKARARGEALVPPEHPQGAAALVLQTPVVAALNGSAHGLGAELAMAADLVVMSQEAVISLPEVRRGLIASGGGAFRLGRCVPPKIAARWLLTGEAVTAAEAERWGLVNEICPPARVLERAIALASVIADNAPLAVQATKRMLGGSDARGVRAHEVLPWRMLLGETAALARSDDAREGSLAFVEGRPPRWTGR